MSDDFKRAAQAEADAFSPRKFLKGSHHYQIAGHVPSPTIRPKPLPDKTPLLVCEKCGSMFGAIIEPPPDNKVLRSLQSSMRLVCANCIAASAQEHGVELGDRASWETAVRHLSSQ